MNSLNLAGWPAILVFLLAGLVAIAFAFVTLNLFVEAMASLRFLRAFGWTAVEHGALLQAAKLLAQGAVALLLWLVFKCCEGELTARYRRWCRTLLRNRSRMS